MHSLRLLLVVLLGLSWGLGSSGHAEEWQQLPSIPDREGFAAPFAGMSHGALLVAGGANFPDKKPWEGGTKRWYDTVYVLEFPAGDSGRPMDSETAPAWQIAGQLPRPLGYGVSVSDRESVICVGGSDSQQHYAEVFRMEWSTPPNETRRRLVTHPLPSLPRAFANGCGAVAGKWLYVAGGQERPDAVTALDTVYRLNLRDPEARWETIAPCPGGGRILATAAAHGEAFYCIGGAELSPGPSGGAQRRYRKDGYCFQEATGWTPLAELPFPVVAAPSPAPVVDGGLYLLGGDDGSQLKTPPTEHKGFMTRQLRYDLEKGQWSPAGKIPAPHVTVPVVPFSEGWIIPSGEARPGVRSPEVWTWMR